MQSVKRKEIEQTPMLEFSIDLSRASPDIPRPINKELLRPVLTNHKKKRADIRIEEFSRTIDKLDTNPLVKQL